MAIILVVISTPVLRLVLFISLFLFGLPAMCQSRLGSETGIKNGYRDQLKQWDHQVKGIRCALESQKTTKNQYQALVKILKHTKRYRDKVKESFDKTEAVIVNLKHRDPTLFDQVDKIRDKDGTATDVYVKVIDDYGEEDGVYGSTNLNQSPNSKNVYVSPYGDHSVLVKIASGRHAVTLLAHEFGHVIYQVPNLASYVRYYEKVYSSGDSLRKCKGHHRSDPSDLSVKNTLKRFKHLYSRGGNRGL